MTTKRTTKKAVAEKATIVAKEATAKSSVKKPTVKQLQELLVLKENLIISLENDVVAAKSNLASAAERALKLDSYVWSLEDEINTLENQSWWSFTKDRIGQTFVRLMGGFK